MKRSIIGMDIDGVIVDLGAAIIPLFAEVCTEPIKYHDLCSWDFRQALNLDEKKTNYVWKRFFNSDILRYAPIIDGAIAGLSALRRHEIWLVTSRPVSTRDITISWLNDNKVHYDRLVFSRQGDKIRAGPRFDVFVEDYLEEAMIIATAGVFTVLFDQPWNQVPKLPKNCNRAYNWDGVLKLIKKQERIKI